MQRLRQLFPWVTFRWWFVPGEKNVADGGSRGLLTDDIEIALAAAHPLLFGIIISSGNFSTKTQRWGIVKHES